MNLKWKKLKVVGPARWLDEGQPSLSYDHGREDKAVLLDRSQELNRLWKGSRLVIFDQAGHTPHQEYPEKLNRLALEFLSK